MTGPAFPNASMKTTKSKARGRLLPVLLIVSLTGTGARSADAADWKLFGPNGPDIEFHGFASQGFIGSTGYNYLVTARAALSSSRSWG